MQRLQLFIPFFVFILLASGCSLFSSKKEWDFQPITPHNQSGFNRIDSDLLDSDLLNNNTSSEEDPAKPKQATTISLDDADAVGQTPSDKAKDWESKEDDETYEDSNSYIAPENWKATFVKDPQGSQYNIALHPSWYWNATGAYKVATFATYPLPLEEGESTEDGDMIVIFNNRKAQPGDENFSGQSCKKKESLDADNALWHLCYYQPGYDDQYIEAHGVVDGRYFSPTIEIVNYNASNLEKAEYILKTMISSISFEE